MAQRVTNAILLELKQAKYYSISVDSMPDLTHVDQLTLTIRYVKHAEPVERFLRFIAIEEHGSEYFANVVLQFLDENSIRLADCRGQSYDNASNMAGQYSGVQARILQQNQFALYVPCGAHSLNLVGVQGAQCCTQATDFFDVVQRIYTFFSGSTRRWNILIGSLKPGQKVVKCLSETRWSARKDAVSALREGYGEICSALGSLAASDSQPAEARAVARGLLQKLGALETGFLSVLWNDILTRFDSTSKILQKSDVCLSVAVNSLRSLKEWIFGIRNNFAHTGRRQKRAKTVVPDVEYCDVGRRHIKRSRHMHDDDGSAAHTRLSGSDLFRVGVFLPIVDTLAKQLTQRLVSYKQIAERYDFFDKLSTLTSPEIDKYSMNLASFLNQDLDGQELATECQHLKHYDFHLLATQSDSQISITDIYRRIKFDYLEPLFPNVEIALRIFLSMMVSNCFGERSFSRLGLIKNRLRSTMSQDRLNALSILSIECELMNQLDFDDMIAEFSRQKSRKANM